MSSEQGYTLQEVFSILKIDPNEPMTPVLAEKINDYMTQRAHSLPSFDPRMYRNERKEKDPSNYLHDRTRNSIYNIQTSPRILDVIAKESIITKTCSFIYFYKIHEVIAVQDIILDFDIFISLHL
jgi:hypothetical protein